jgi:ribosome-associated heat shock protein Hsp15
VNADTQRLDKWLWCARFFKSRSAASRFCSDGRLRITGQVTHKAHHAVRPGDVLTFPLGPHIRVIRILALATRRGPAAEARTLYEDLSSPVSLDSAAPKPDIGRRDAGTGRPTKAERRAIDRLRGTGATDDE